ncbi:MAG: D-tyrosyl-tRNA(Tyr) deacylase [Ignavibacteriae bacterium]|nr:D-tyrosyl-tRNA(Tyr) deacylase [Ignavibacteriota bacterium]
MRALVQRVSKGGVKVESHNYNERIEKGLVVLLGVTNDDTIKEADFVADKCCNLRIFSDEEDKMNLSVKDVNGEMLIISQFTLYGDAKKGNRPNFTNAAKPDKAEELYEYFISRVEQNLGAEKVKKGIFGGMMEVEIINDGPVTILVESK